jgi:membrane protein implicated in regulation of membrane protease activity
MTSHPLLFSFSFSTRFLQTLLRVSSYPSIAITREMLTRHNFAMCQPSIERKRLLSLLCSFVLTVVVTSVRAMSAGADMRLTGVGAAVSAVTIAVATLLWLRGACGFSLVSSDMLVSGWFCSALLAHTLAVLGFGAPVDQPEILVWVLAAVLLPALTNLPFLYYRYVAFASAILISAVILRLQLNIQGFMSALAVLSVLLASLISPALVRELRETRRSAAADVRREVQAQVVLLHRVIPEVFVESLLTDRKTTSPPMPDITVIFVEVMVLTTSPSFEESALKPRKLGNNISADTLDILSHVFNILDRVVSRNGSEFGGVLCDSKRAMPRKLTLSPLRAL